MRVTIEIAVEAGGWPAEPVLQALAEQAVSAAAAALQTHGSLRGASAKRGETELSLVFTDDVHIRRLNSDYRGQDKRTNVLSFPQASGPLLGDVILAFETVRDEATLAEKPLEAHMAHLVVHGFLHLLGYDHESEAEAEEMEALETAAMEKIGIADPYAASRDR